MKQFLLTTIIIPLLLSAQTENIQLFRSSNPPSQKITAIATDVVGLNWIGTLEGLICYNGEGWHKITTKNSIIPSNKILSIAINNDVKYIGTTEGLLVIKNNNWTVFTSENSDLPSNKIRKIIINNNTVWIATSKGLVKYNNDFDEAVSQLKFQYSDFEVVLSGNKNGIIDDDFISMNIDNNGIVWLGTNNGLYRFKNNIWRVFTNKNSQLPDNHIWDIVVDGQNRKWIGTKKGIAVFQDSKWVLFDKKNTPLKSNNIRSVIYDDYDRVWVGTERGVVSYDGDRWIKHKINNKNSKNSFIISVFVDGFDNKWVCTSNNLIVYNTEGVEFKNNITANNSVIVLK